ncbi:MAG: hypothetical protein US81_C0043G0002 [Parcubacteria group bacterium GW2011_GWE2_38_18]|nr:MAG: hypothetical protein US81_C0043G0002 [Parcubacteria group bacterium GW2011_GWE2_38_18]
MRKKIMVVISLVVVVTVLAMSAYLLNKQQSATDEPRQILQEQKTGQPEAEIKEEIGVIKEQPPEILELEGVITAVNDGSVEVENKGVKTTISLTGNEELIVRSPGQQ